MTLFCHQSKSGILLVSIKSKPGTLIILLMSELKKSFHIIQFSAAEKSSILVCSVRLIHFSSAFGTELFNSVRSDVILKAYLTLWSQHVYRHQAETTKHERRHERRGMNSAETTHVLIDVKESGHDGVLDGSQISLVPEDTEHPPHTVTAGVVTGHILQQEGLLTAERQRGRDREQEGKCMLRFSTLDHDTGALWKVKLNRKPFVSPADQSDRLSAESSPAG